MVSGLRSHGGAMDIRDRVALVTGAGAGAGRAIAARLAAEGAAVVVADIGQEGGRDAVRRIQSAGGRAAFTRADVTVEPDGRDGVRVNCVVPDWIWSEAAAAHLAALPPDDPGYRPARLTPPEDIAGAVARLVRDDSLAGRVLVCWCDHPWALVGDGDLGYRDSEVMPVPPPAPAPTAHPGGAG